MYRRVCIGSLAERIGAVMDDPKAARLVIW